MNALAPPAPAEGLAPRTSRAPFDGPGEPLVELGARQVTPKPACAADEARWLRRVGAVVSGACVVHCAATPLLGAALPSLTGWLSQPALHWGLAALAISAWVASVSSARGRTQPWTLWLGGSGLAILCGGAFGPLLWDSRLWTQVPLGIACSCLGGGLLFASHFLRRSAARGCRCAKHSAAT